MKPYFTRAEHIQKLVDDHAAFDFMPHDLIVSHLRKEHGIKLFEKVPKPTDNPVDWTESEMFERTYKGVGQTSLDRLLTNVASINKKFGSDAGRSNFELVRDGIIYLDSHEAPHHKQTSDSIIKIKNGEEEWDIYRAIHTALHPWIVGEEETLNIQISSEMAEIILAGTPPKSTEWIKVFMEKPVYIDIKETLRGERSLSGIFCWPNNKGGFSFLGVVEWTGQGYESFLMGEYDEETSVLVMRPGDNDYHPGMEGKELIPQEMLDEAYNPMINKIETIIAMTYMYYKTNMDAKKTLSLLPITPKGLFVAGDSKKDRNKEKTHSYFRVVKMDVPADRFGFKGKTGRSWSLDHLITTNGHFRWQPYGEGSALRKLIWIDSYEKGVGDRHRPDTNPELSIMKM